MLPTLPDVGAVGFLAHRMQIQLTHQVLEPYIVSTTRGSNLEPRWLAFREGSNPVSTHDLVKRIRHSEGIFGPLQAHIRFGAPNLEAVLRKVSAT
jgi:hypothetical protein